MLRFCLFMQWLDDHPKYLSNPFYIGGDSYAGKVVPLITQYLSEGKSMCFLFVMLASDIF